MSENFIYHQFERSELRLYKSAWHIITVTEAFKFHIANRGIAPNKISVIKNGVNHKLFNPRKKNRLLESELGLNRKFIVGFVGTLGMAHKLDFISKAAEKITDPSIHLLFVGEGAERKNLEDLIKKRNLSNITMLGMIPKERVPDYLSIIDISLINLRKSETFKTVIPSKIFESSAMEKPILLGVDGEARQLIESYQAGLYYEPENEADFLEKLYLLRNDTALYDTMILGCRQLAIDYDRVKLATEMASILYSLVENES